MCFGHKLKGSFLRGEFSQRGASSYWCPWGRGFEVGFRGVVGGGVFLLKTKEKGEGPGRWGGLGTGKGTGKSMRMRLLSGLVSRDTARLSQRYPPIARYGVFGVSTWPIGCDTPSSSSERFPLGEHAKWRCDTPPPPQKGYLSDTCAIPYENKANGCDTPLCDTISKGYCAIWGDISHWAAKCVC